MTTDERSPKDYAIEFAEYMAKAADNFLALYDSGKADPFDMADYRRALASSVYEFRKRAKRATTAQGSEGV